jgi:hypothetical protein
MRLTIPLILFAFSLNAAAAAKSTSCEKWLKAVNKYEDMEKGKIVWKFSIYNFTNWNPDEQFTAAVLIKSVEKGEAAPELEVRYKSSASTKTEIQTYKLLRPFELDPRLKEFDDFKPRQFFHFEEPGTFTLTLKSGTKILCTHNGKYGLGD